MHQQNFSWNTPPAELQLASHEVHVWRASLDQLASDSPQLSQLLSSDEQARAERFYFERDRTRFIVGRGLLRKILGRYLGIEPSQLQFCYGARGKPSLVATAGQSPLRFNLSHSQGLALYAFSQECEIGIDLEQIRPLAKAEQLVERFFSVRENTVFQSLPANQQQEAFFNAWTCKEAYLKATGEGLAGSLDQVEVSLRPGEPAQLLSLNGDTQRIKSWSLYQLTAEPGYAAALAVEGQNHRLSCWQWSE